MFSSKIKALFGGRAKSFTAPEPATNYNANISVSRLVYGLGAGSYDNNFASVSRIAENFAEVMPFAIDENGERLASDPQALRVLKNPNRQMSGHEFIETLITMMLVHPQVYVLVWTVDGGEVKAGGRITPDNIGGFTFLEEVSVSKIGGDYFYRTDKGKVFTSDEVLRFSLNVNPYAIATGYSPSVATKKWATVSDYIADYHAGYFANGAIPAGQMVITAGSVDDFNRTVDQLQAHHRGASNSNNLTYVHRPVSSIDGKPMSAGIEWVPFEAKSDNKTVTSLFDQSNKQLDMGFGVPQEVKGYLSNSNYASVETADYIFERYVIFPKLVKVWSKFTHELNRVTGGLGWAFSFDYQMPTMTEALTSQVSSLTSLLNAGYSVEASVEALGLPSSFLALKDGRVLENANAQGQAVADADQSDDGEDVANIAEPAKLKTLDIEENAKDEVDPALVAFITAFLAGILTEAQTRVMLETPTAPLNADALKLWLQDSGYVARNADLMSGLLANIEAKAGAEALVAFAEQLDVKPSRDFGLTPAEAEAIKVRTGELLASFGSETADHVQAVVDRAETEGWRADTVAMVAAIQALASADAYRADRWAQSENHRAVETGVLRGAELAGAEVGMKPMKTWRINPASPDLCSNCLMMNGETVAIDAKFSNGDDIPHYHPHCYCTMDISFVPVVKSVHPAKVKAVKVECPHCGRYMFESDGGAVKGVICANSKCKRRWDISVNNGEISAEEISK